MFNHIGGKIKRLSQWLCWLEIIVAVIYVVVLWSQHGGYDTLWQGICVLVGGSVGSWVGLCFMYGFGKLIEETILNRQTNEEIHKMLYKQLHPKDKLTGAARAAAIVPTTLKLQTPLGTGSAATAWGIIPTRCESAGSAARSGNQKEGRAPLFFDAVRYAVPAALPTRPAFPPPADAAAPPGGTANRRLLRPGRPRRSSWRQ